jgi:2'-5' RNA ligase
MNKRAVNIALIPEESMYNQVLELNEILVSQGSDLVLGKEAIPHITLVQGVVSESDIEKVCSVLEKAASSAKRLNLTVDELFIGPMSKSIWLKIKKTENVYDLHKIVWQELKPYLTFDAEKSVFVNNPSGISFEIGWVKDFPIKSVLEQYKPHITLGFGQIHVDLPMYFVSDKLAIYQMGKYCSCSKEIKTYALK